MKKIMFLISLSVFLASCDQKDSCLDAGWSYDEKTWQCITSQQDNTWSVENSSNQHIVYPSDQLDTPATRFCESKGGQILIENKNNIEIAYCTINNEKVDAWTYYSDNQ